VSTPARTLRFAQIGFFVALATCVLIDPDGMHDNHGWSYYEERGATVVPYLLGVLVFIVLTLHAASLLERSATAPGLARGLKLLTLFLLLDAATPDTVDTAFYWGHDLASTLLFLFELGFAIWLVRVVWRTNVGIWILAVQFLGGLVAMFSQLHVISQLGLGILVFQLSFGILLVAATAAVRVDVRNGAAPSEEASVPAITH
jgi:hypothetical protein